MPKIISICNQKGGTGKTTTAINLASSLALAGQHILLVDVDPQGNTTSGLGIDKNSLKASIYDGLLNHLAASEITIKTQVPNLELIPSNIDLTGAEIELVSLDNREQQLRSILQPLKSLYDFIFIDSPPSLGLLTLNSLVACDSLIIPIQCEFYALEGVTQLLKTIKLIKERLNPNLEVEGVLLTMADFRTNLTSEVINEIRNFFKERVYHTIIPRNIRLSEAPSFGKPVFLYDKHSIGAKRYEELAQEMLRHSSVPSEHIKDTVDLKVNNQSPSYNNQTIPNAQ